MDLLRRHGWSIIAAADTAMKAPGVDVLARKGERRLGAEVKGWPSDAVDAYSIAAMMQFASGGSR
jgi:Holliday junction resolvase